MSRKQPVKYHNPDSCNKCKGTNCFINPSYDSGLMSETKTKCEACGFSDYWAFGFFESGSEMESKCDTYSFTSGQDPIEAEW